MTAGALLLLVVFEGLCRVLPVSTATEVDYYIDPHILTYPKEHRFITSFGWNLERVRHQRTNNYGFLAAEDFAFDPSAVAVIGDSYADSAMLSNEDRPDRQLEKATGRKVFTLGGPGSNLLDYAERMRFARERFGIEDFVVLVERGDVSQVMCGSGNVHAICIEKFGEAPVVRTQPEPARLKGLLRHSAVAQYLFSQLRIKPGRLIEKLKLWKRGPAGVDKPLAHAQDSPRALEDRRVWRLFLERVAALSPRRVVFVFDADRYAVYDGQPRNPDWARKAGLEFAAAAGYLVVDLEPPFRDYYARTGRTLDVAPNDGHWNATAVAIITREVAAQLR